MIISAANLTKSFGRIRAVDDLSFGVEEGKALALWGVNGAGKTTVIRCVLGVLRFRGRITVGGIDVRKRGKAARRLIGYVPQELAFHDDMRVRNALWFFSRLRGVDPRPALDLLERVGLAGSEGKRLRELSGGMKQRLALAFALLSDPPIIILDEPTSNLDAGARSGVIETLVDLKKSGKTILFASHRTEEVTALADRVVTLEKGRLVREVDASDFAPAAAMIRTLHLRVPAEAVPVAIRTLQARGLTATPNGRGLYVQVAPSSKGAPFNILAGARIDVHDFELLPPGNGVPDPTTRLTREVEP
jgi:ABC-type multidrug transport system ATPase subunit